MYIIWTTLNTHAVLQIFMRFVDWVLKFLQFGGILSLQIFDPQKFSQVMTHSIPCWKIMNFYQRCISDRPLIRTPRMQFYLHNLQCGTHQIESGDSLDLIWWLTRFIIESGESPDSIWGTHHIWSPINGWKPIHTDFQVNRLPRDSHDSCCWFLWAMT